MRGNWHSCLALILITIIAVASCRKHHSNSLIVDPPNLPEDTIRGNDSVPDTDTIPGEPAAPKYNQVPVHLDINKNVGGYYEALPPEYDSTSKTYPLLLFLHGGGELGNGKDELSRVLKNSVTRRLYDKTLPTTFTVDGVQFSFIIVSPQFKKWPSVNDVQDIFEFLLTRYRIDTRRMYLSGLSMGGGTTWEYAGSPFGSSVAAIVPICGASWADSAVAKRIAKNDVPGWAFHNVDDNAVTVNSTKRYVNIINSQKPLRPIRMTLWPTGGHDAWTLASDPEYREDGKNMYEWMLQYRR
jgi:predicted peptidase